MMFWVGTTDTRWFEFLAPRQLDEVNFWQPSVRPAFENAPSGMPFVFKVKRPHNHIAGAGYFITRSVLPLDLATCLRAAGLPRIHNDPVDRFIIAAAKIYDCAVVTSDERFAEYGIPTLI